MKCGVIDCDIQLEFDLSKMVESCIWCRKELRPEWEDSDWEQAWHEDMEREAAGYL